MFYSLYKDNKIIFKRKVEWWTWFRMELTAGGGQEMLGDRMGPEDLTLLFLNNLALVWGGELTGAYYVNINKILCTTSKERKK